MATPTTYSFGFEPISCHAWNKDRTQLALSLNNHEVNIYKFAGNKWEKIHTLSEHTQRVTSIDWAPNSNRIATCGADRNAYVWTYENGAWQPTLVIVRLNRAATVCKWSPLENKFAVGSGARLVAICYFEAEHNWWVSKHIRKPIRSTVLSLEWHPNNYLIACGASDFKARVFSAYIKEIEAKPEATVWGKKMTFTHLMAEFSNGGGGWVHSVAFSPSGNKLAWVGHDSSISVVDMSQGPDAQPSTLKTQFLPFNSCLFVTENSLIAAGHDCNPLLFIHDNNLRFSHKLDVPKQKETGRVSAMDRFKSLDTRGQAGTGTETTLETKHQNTITQIASYAGERQGITKFSTSGVDSLMCIWDLKTLEAQIAGLKIQ